ncbi:MAG TPA: diguanylate cyclase [Candidatus Acidoferrales bacterium]|nr:diguanylate cyclase [Candidatus Acidoferrales bacterium]
MNGDSPILGALRQRPLRVLWLEDSASDFEFCIRELRRARLEVVADVVRTEGEFVDKLLGETYDVVLADYKLEGWTGMDALARMRELRRDTPLILVTGALGDAVVVDCLKRGVADYVLKDRVARLPIAICKALEEKYLREERKLAHNQLRESEEKFRALAESIASAIFIYRGTQCRYANRAAEIITGYDRSELLELSSWDLIHPDSRESVIQMGLTQVPGEAVPRRYELKIITKAGAARWLDVTSSFIEVEGRRGGLITAFDVTERKEAEEAVQRLVASDPLTGLANYRRLLDAFQCELKRSGRTGRSFSLVLFDLDGLKRINDAYGHLAGSRALCRVGNVLRAQCRSMDVPARFGGDEFAIILPETGADAARHVASRVADTVQNDGELPKITVSFGLAVCPDDGGSFKDVMLIADSGLYLMKGQPRLDDLQFNRTNLRLVDSAD